ncbi:MAG: cation-translocating P-type ATPase [Vicinamibacterales bacterium]
MPPPTARFQDIATRPSDEALSLLSSGRDGLSQDEAAARLAEHGPNEISGAETTALEILLRQFKSSFVYLLLAASAIAIYLREYLDAAVIFLFLVINALLGFVQEYRAEHALQLLKQFVERRTRVRRSGQTVSRPVRDIVPGDIVQLAAGDTIPGDGLFIRADGVEVDESPMTGETAPVEKRSGPLAAPPDDVYGAANIGFTRTTLLAGDADLLVFATGNHTAVGEIAGRMRAAEAPSAFELGLAEFSRFVLKLVGVTVPLVYLLHALVTASEVTTGQFLLFSIALTVSAIPEALPLVTTISLSRGALALAKKDVVPRRLSAIEDLGSINVLATDKTGTITENALSVADVYGDRDATLRHALMVPMARGSSSVQNQAYDAAILAAVDEAARAQLAGLTLVDELPFDPVRRRATVLVEADEGDLHPAAGVQPSDPANLRNPRSLRLISRGAPEAVYAGAHDQAAALAWAAGEGRKGRRVLAVASREVPADGRRVVSPGDEGGLMPVGIISFTDPLKPTTRAAVREAERLGVRVKIITGDSKDVAGWVGVEIGLMDDPAEVLLGSEFARMTAAERASAVDRYDVFARATPEQKFDIVKALDAKHLVGFLGEGFNDAPALKMAHVGLAVNGASDIAQDAADVVLLNRSLEVIVDGIREGRTIFANTMKYIRATLTSNVGNFYALAFAALFIPYLPMLPIQILLLNLLSDFPMISIAADSVDEAELAQPRGYQVAELTGVAMVLGAISTLFDFAFFGYFVRFGEPALLQTMWFMGSVLTELVLLFSIRTTLPFWRSTPPSATVVGLTLTVMAAAVGLPFIAPARALFGFVVPAPEHLAMAFALVVIYFAATEGAKLMLYRYWKAG